MDRNGTQASQPHLPALVAGDRFGRRFRAAPGFSPTRLDAAFVRRHHARHRQSQNSRLDLGEAGRARCGRNGRDQTTPDVRMAGVAECLRNSLPNHERRAASSRVSRWNGLSARARGARDIPTLSAFSQSSISSTPLIQDSANNLRRVAMPPIRCCWKTGARLDSRLVEEFRAVLPSLAGLR